MAAFFRRRQQGDQVYARIRRRLDDYEWPPGKLLSVRVVAGHLEARRSPVRKACRRLVDEGLAICADKHHFLVWPADESVLIRLYDTTEDLLISAVDLVTAEQSGSECLREAVQRVCAKLSRPEISDETLAVYIGELFFAIVAASGEERPKDLMRASNERLYYLRVLENRHLDDTAGDLRELCELASAGRQDDLKPAIKRYHRSRCEFLSDLLRFVAAG